jgi:hypothetical protein
MWKKLTAFVLAIALVPAAAFAAPAATSQVTIKVEYNKKAIVFPDQKPVIRDKRTLVPIRPIAESLGFDVKWDSATRTVTIVKGVNSVKLVVSQKIAKRNGQTITLDVPAQIINNRTMVPVRFIAEALNYEVNWAAATQTVLIADKAQTTEPTPQQPAEQQPAAVDLIDEDSIEAKAINIVSLGVYRVTGKVEPGSDLKLVLDDDTYEVPVESDGSFTITQESSDGIESFTLKASKDGKEDILEGKFEF